MTLLRRTRRAKLPAAIRPNAGIEQAYRTKLTRLIDEMNKSVEYWVKAAYRNNEPAISLAQDATPADALRDALRKLGRQWEKNFAKAAEELAGYFAKSVNHRSDAQLKAILRKGGFSVRFTMTPAQRDIIQATINENVRLIKSIPAQYLTQVEGSVMRSVQTGRDIGFLTKELQQHYGVTRRRAGFIARDQNNKASATLSRARQIEVGITEAVWQHSAGGKTPRPNHVAFGREKKRYNVEKGMWDPDANGKGKGEWIWPGTLPNCRCFPRPVVPEFN